MSRPRFAFVTTFVSCLLLAHTGYAGINFSPVPPVNVGPHPEFMAAGDLNNDGKTDIVVISPTSKEIDTFIAADTPSKFAPAQVLTIPGSRKLQGVTLGDLNADGRLDLVVADQAIQVIWVLLGRGDGTFLTPFQVTIAMSRRLTAVAIANFDGSGNPDIAVTDDKLGKVFLLLNDNNNPPGFTLAGDVDVGLQPDDIRGIDLNRDGKPDILTLNQGGPRVKELAVLLLQRVVDGFPQFAAPQKYTIGEKPSDMVIADFNNDGNPDIAMLNHPSGTNGVDEVDVLLGQDSGVFFPPTAVPVPCPFFTGGAPCRLKALAVGDFDGNGDADFMVALSDPRSIGAMNDQMQAFGGQGDGTFVAGGLFTIGKNPFSMTAADITGNGRLDVAVATQAALDLQAFINVSTAGGVVNGDPCVQGSDCLADRCTNGVCCAAQCAADEVCNVPGREGTCVPIPPVPTPCTLPNAPECTTIQFCVDGYCCDQLCTGGHCDRMGFLGVCIPGIPDGQPCSGDNEECSSNFCSPNLVCCREACDGGFCEPDTGVCDALQPLGSNCDVDEQCMSSVCDQFDGICCNRKCDPIQEKCDTFPDALNGHCVSINYTPSIAPTPTATPTLRLTPGVVGEPCSTPGECGSGFCVNKVCCTTNSCDSDQHCELGSGVCVGGALTPTPTIIPTPLPTLPTPNPCGGCPSGSVCSNGLCVKTNTGGGCSTSDGAGPGNLTGIALLPLALWMSRRWQLHRARLRAPARQ
jgi:hypothetical protein